MVIPDEIAEIQSKIRLYAEDGISLVMITGGTGLSKRDVTPKLFVRCWTEKFPGVAEAIRNYGQQRTPYSMLSRSLAGMIGDTLVIALPCSTKGAEESMDSIFPWILHIYKILNGGKH